MYAQQRLGIEKGLTRRILGESKHQTSSLFLEGHSFGIKEKRYRENEERCQRPLLITPYSQTEFTRDTSSRISSITLMCIDCLHSTKIYAKGLSEAKDRNPDKQGRHTAWV